MGGQFASVEPWDGIVDTGFQPHPDAMGMSGTAPAGEPEVRDARATAVTSAEVVAHALLRLAAECPGRMGRERAARIVGGYAVAYRDADERAGYEHYVVARDWRRRELVELVDALIDGGLVVQTVGTRPLLVLTRAGHHALNALEGTA